MASSQPLFNWATFYFFFRDGPASATLSSHIQASRGLKAFNMYLSSVVAFTATVLTSGLFRMKLASHSALAILSALRWRLTQKHTKFFSNFSRSKIFSKPWIKKDQQIMIFLYCIVRSTTPADQICHLLGNAGAYLRTHHNE